jgi:hypothetical protein
VEGEGTSNRLRLGSDGVDGGIDVGGALASSAFGVREERRRDVGDDPVALCVLEIDAGASVRPVAGGESTGDVSAGDGAVVLDEVLALVAGRSSVALRPLRGDGGGDDDVRVVFLPAAGDGDSFSDG